MRRQWNFVLLVTLAATAMLLWRKQWNQPAGLQQRPHPSRISRAYGDAIGFFWNRLCRDQGRLSASFEILMGP